MYQHAGFRVANVVLRISKFCSSVILVGIVGWALSRIHEGDGPYGKRLVYVEIVAALSIALSLVLMPRMKHVFMNHGLAARRDIVTRQPHRLTHIPIVVSSHRAVRKDCVEMGSRPGYLGTATKGCAFTDGHSRNLVDLSLSQPLRPALGRCLSVHRLQGSHTPPPRC
jgi:hypothetical protein